MTFVLGQLDSGMVPRMVERTVAAGQAFNKGALLLIDANNQYAECGADPAAVAAIANSDYGADTTGFSRLGFKEFPPGSMQGIGVQGETPFHAEYVGSLPAVAGGSFGVVRGGDGKWRVDFAETVNTRVRLLSIEWTRSPLNRNRVLVCFLPGNVQLI